MPAAKIAATATTATAHDATAMCRAKLGLLARAKSHDSTALCTTHRAPATGMGSLAFDVRSFLET